MHRIAIDLPGQRSVTLDDGVLAPFQLSPAGDGSPALLPRRAFAAAHVAVDAGYAQVPHSLEQPGSAQEIANAIDWETTMSLRVRLDGLGFGIAEAMDTAQRFELGWAGAKELMERTGKLGLKNGFIGAASADHVASIESGADLSRALAEQATFIKDQGGLPILLPQPWLTRSGATEEDFVRVYCDAIDAIDGELLLHWLGEPFHPDMAGYFPGDSLSRILAHDPKKVRGMKISMLDRELEERLREEIAFRGQVIFTGDDYHFTPLIEGYSQESREMPPLDGRPLRGGRYSHALLGILNAIARPASLALQHLGNGDIATYRQLMGPCEALGREIFKAPVQRYKSGIVFLAWLNGLQPNRMLVNHEETARTLDDYLRIAQMASEAGAIEDAPLAAERLRSLVTDPSPGLRDG